MAGQNLKEKIISTSVENTSWLERAKQRQKNKNWLKLSFRIALKILRYIRANDLSQKELAERLDWSPQYLSKVLKGKENLTLETICKIQNVTGLSLIQIPSYSSEMKFIIDKIEIPSSIPPVEAKGNMPFFEDHWLYSKEIEETSIDEINPAYAMAA